MKGWQQILLGIIIGTLFAGLIMLFILPNRGKAIALVTKTPNLTPPPTQTLALIQVHISGAVNQPGLIELPKGARLADAIEKAGGLPQNYDLNLLNLSEILIDGQRIHIPQISSGNNAFEAPQRGQSIIAIEENALININTADLDKLCTLPGIGPSKAQAIINYREENGLFMQLEDILKVKGIGPTIFASIKDLITLDDY